MLKELFDAAASLASDPGTNPEYDRALVELVCQFMPGGLEEDTRKYVAARILN